MGFIRVYRSTTAALCLLALLFFPAGVIAQDLEPRTYSNLPIGQNYLIAGYAYSEGEITPAPSVPIKDIDLTVDGFAGAYARTIDLWGDAALAVGLLVVLLLAGVVSQPLLLPLLLDEVSVSPGAIILTLVCTVLVPLLLGLQVRQRLARLASSLQLPMQRLSTLSMLLILILLPILHWQELREISRGGAFAAALLFIALATIGGWLLGGPQPTARRMLSLSCGQPNMAAAMIIAGQNFSDPRVALMLLVIMISSLPIVISLSLLYARQEREEGSLRPDSQ